MPRVPDRVNYRRENPPALRSVASMFSEFGKAEKATRTHIGNHLSLPPDHHLVEAMYEELEKLRQVGKFGYTDTAGDPIVRDAVAHLHDLEDEPFFETMQVFALNGLSQGMGPFAQIAGGGEFSIATTGPGYGNWFEANRSAGNPDMLVIDIDFVDNGNGVGVFKWPEISDIKERILSAKVPVNGLVIIPDHNPMGIKMSQEYLKQLAMLCIELEIYFMIDYAYKDQSYEDRESAKVWDLLNDPDVNALGEKHDVYLQELMVEGRSMSKRGFCGVRSGWLTVADEKLAQDLRAVLSMELNPNLMGQATVTTLLALDGERYEKMLSDHDNHFGPALRDIAEGIRVKVKEKVGIDILVSDAETALYLVMDLRNFADQIEGDISSREFAFFCAVDMGVKYRGINWTSLFVPMDGFYGDAEKGRYQLRISVAADVEEAKIVPHILPGLILRYMKFKERGGTLDNLLRGELL